MTPPVRDVLDRLYAIYGRPERSGPDDLLGTLIRTILSQNTNRANTDRAFGRLLDRFDADWDRMRRAPVEEVVEAIEIGGLARQKAPRIQAILDHLHRKRGEYSLEFLRQRDPDDARDYLLAFDGVGPKTAAFTLMHAAEMPVFPMDTHILRICRRLGWIGEETGSRRAHQQMEPEIPHGEHTPAHLVMVRHGRERCHARTPECGDCSLLDLCPEGSARTEG